MFLICILFLPIHTKCELVLWNIAFLFKRYNYITKYVKTNVATNTLTHIHSKHNLDIRTHTLPSISSFKRFTLPHISNHVCAKNSLKFWECLDVKLNAWCEHKNRFLINIRKNTFLPKYTSLMFMWRLHQSGNYRSESNTLTWAPHTT